MNKMLFVLSLIFIFSCVKENNIIPTSHELKIKGADLSFLPMIESKNLVFYDHHEQPNNVLSILKNAGLNTVRVRIWHNPIDEHSGLNEVKQFSQRIHQAQIKLWLCIHYSDTWADPGHQEMPVAWQGLPFNILKDSVFNYTKKIILQTQPEYVQIGNEINSGILFPFGNLSSNESQFKELLNEGIRAVRTFSPQTKIILHFAGHTNAQWFFNKMTSLDYDIIGLSYYPIWHGKDLNALKNNIEILSNSYNKEVVIAETAYPFTLTWNDWTNNIVGMENQLINTFPASEIGQKEFLTQLKNNLMLNEKAIGFCYWGAEYVSFNGPTATDGSPWENQALFNFNNKEVLATDLFRN